jgi:hypothetical protein
VGGRRGRETRQRARVRTRWSTAGVRKAELIGLAHGAEREKRDARGNDSTTGDPGPKDRERGSARAKETGADRSAPLGSERERERALGFAPTGGARLSGREGARAREHTREWAAFSFYFSLDFLIPFIFLFLLGFQIQIQTRFQIQINSNLCNTSKNILSSA